MKLAYIGIDLLLPALRALIREGCEVLRIFTCDTDNVTEFNVGVVAEAAALGVECVTRRITAGDIARLADEGCEAVVCAGYYHRVPVTGLLPMVNIHPYLLPEGRGPWPMPVAILRRLTVGGVTIHRMTDRFDEGGVLLRRSFSLADDENLKTYMAKACDAVDSLVPTLVARFGELYASAVPQSGGEYWRSPTEADWTLDASMDGERIDRVLRAFYGYECVWRDGARSYEIIGGRLLRERPPSGEYIDAHGAGFIVYDSIRELTP